MPVTLNEVINNLFQRPIEFRAWNTVTKQMHYDINVMASGLSDCILLQYTGYIHSVSGHKLYEGDVLRLDVTWDGEVPEDEEEYYFFKLVCYNHGLFHLLDMGDLNFYEDQCALWHYNLEGAELVGNVFEKPELLELTGCYPIIRQSTELVDSN